MLSLRLNKQLGVTLVELMVTISIVAIMLLIAVPSFQSYTGTQRLRSASADIVASLNIARSEAAKRNTNVTISTDSDWEGGWTVAVTGGATIRTFDAIDAVSFTVEDPGGNAVTSLEYGNDGRLTGGTNVSFEVDNDPSVSGISARCVQVSLSGKPKTDKGACP